MKRIIILFLLSLLIFSSCTKSKSVSTPEYYLSSIKSFYGSIETIDSIKYDNNHNIVELLQYQYNTDGTINPTNIVDSDLIVFSIPANSLVPVSYYIDSLAQSHQLYFDANNRIIEDSSIQSINRYTYPDKNMASSLFIMSGVNTYTEVEADTDIINNGNVSLKKTYNENSLGIVDTLVAATQFNYSSYINPEYNANIASTIGPLLSNIISTGIGGVYTDFISKNLVNEIAPTGLSSYAVNYNYSLDEKGRVVQGTYGEGTATIIFSYY